MALKWGVLLFLVGCIVSPVMRFGGGKSAPQAQHETLDKFTPGRLSFEPRWKGPVAEAKIRVYADDEYCAQNRKWQEAFDEHLEYVNAVLRANFGAQASIDSDTEVVVTKQADVPTAAVTDVIAQLNAVGLAHVVFK